MKTVIDIRTNIDSAGLFSRMIWEELFRQSSAWNFNSLDSFLCDLDIFRKKIDQCDSFTSFIWAYDPKSGWTEIFDASNYFFYFNEGNQNTGFIVDFVRGKTITIYNANQTA